MRFGVNKFLNKSMAFHSLEIFLSFQRLSFGFEVLDVNKFPWPARLSESLSKGVMLKQTHFYISGRADVEFVECGTVKDVNVVHGDPEKR
jgi:hypothetical protein